MTWVKVCGLTNRDDVNAAVEAGADAVGFVTVPSSPRFVTMEQAHTLADGVQAMRILLTIDLPPADAVAESAIGVLMASSRTEATDSRRPAPSPQPAALPWSRLRFQVTSVALPICCQARFHCLTRIRGTVLVVAA